MKSILCCVAAAAFVAATAVQAQFAPKTVFHPAGPWIADYGDDYCRISRTFMADQSELSVALERLQPGPMVRLIVVGEGLRPFDRAEQIGYAFEPRGSSSEAHYVRWVMADGRPFLSFNAVALASLQAGGSTLPVYDRALEQEAAQGITGFTLDEGLRSPIRVETGSLRAPIEALQACTDDLLTAWGLDPEKYDAITAPPTMKPSSGGVLPQGTVPMRELRNLGGGTNQVQLLVGADGNVADCRIHAPSLTTPVNERICQLASERASFVPATDADGQPMASLWIGSPLDLLPSSPRFRGDRGLVGSSALGPTWGLTSPPSDAPMVVLVVPAGPPGN